MNFLKNLFKGRPPATEQIRYNIDQESVKQDMMIQGQQNQIAELHGALGRAVAENASFRQSEKDINEEKNVINQLNEQENQIRADNYGKFFSLKEFFKVLNSNKRFAQNLKIVTFDRKTVISRFNDWGFSEQGFTLFGEGMKKILTGSKLKDILFNPDSMANDIKNGFIPVCLDDKGGYVENIMIWKPAKALHTPDGIEYQASRKEPFYKVLQELEEDNSGLRQSLEEKEETINGLQNKVDDLQSANKISQKSGETARNNATKNAEKLSEVEKVFSSITNDLNYQQNINIQNDKKIKMTEESNDKLLAKAEREGSKVEFDDVVEKINAVKGLLRDKSQIYAQPVQNVPQKPVSS